MKDAFKALGIIALTAIIWFVGTSCEGASADSFTVLTSDVASTGGQGALPVDDYSGALTPGINEKPVPPPPVEEPKLDGTELRYNDFLYTVSDFITIAGYTGNEVSISIPAEIDGKPVVIIGPGAFIEKQLIGVTIPSSVTSIASKAFYGNLLTSITLGNDITSVGVLAFDGNQLTSVSIGANVSLGYNSFGSEGFQDAYIRGGRRAGTYTRPDADSSLWSHN